MEIDLTSLNLESSLNVEGNVLIPEEYLTNNNTNISYNGNNYTISNGDITVRALEIAMAVHDTTRAVIGGNTVIADKMFFGNFSTVTYMNANEYTKEDLNFGYSCVLSDNSKDITIKDFLAHFHTEGRNVKFLLEPFKL